MYNGRVRVGRETIADVPPSWWLIKITGVHEGGVAFYLPRVTVTAVEKRNRLDARRKRIFGRNKNNANNNNDNNDNRSRNRKMKREKKKRTHHNRYTSYVSIIYNAYARSVSPLGLCARCFYATRE